MRARSTAYLAAFGEVYDVLTDAGLSVDAHGASATHRGFARTNAAWRAAAREWLAAPEANQGAIMTSLLVDGRPIYGDPGLPAVTDMFSGVRRHPGTLRLLMQASLARRARYRSVRDIFTRRDAFDLKSHALLPLVNIARDRMSPIDRSMLAQAVREIAAVQHRMDNVAAYLPADAWASPANS